MIMQLQHSRPRVFGHARRNQELVCRDTNTWAQERNTLEQVKCNFCGARCWKWFALEMSQRAYRGGSRESTVRKEPEPWGKGQEPWGNREMTRCLRIFNMLSPKHDRVKISAAWTHDILFLQNNVACTCACMQISFNRCSFFGVIVFFERLLGHKYENCVTMSIRRRKQKLILYDIQVWSHHGHLFDK